MGSLVKTIETVLRHIGHVQENTRRLGLALIEEGDTITGVNLIRNGLKHDSSKLYGIELQYLGNFEKEKPPEFKLALQQHTLANPHHAEYWGGIHNMPKVYLYEMACDLAARSSELGTCVWDYLHNNHMKIWNFTKEDEAYKTIHKALSIILETWE